VKRTEWNEELDFRPFVENRRHSREVEMIIAATEIMGLSVP